MERTSQHPPTAVLAERHRPTEPDAASPSRRSPAVRTCTVVRQVLPGLGAAGAITAVAIVLGDLAPVIGAPVFAILIGIVVALLRPPGDALGPGIRFTSKRILQGSIVVLGFGLSLGQIVTVGAESLPVLTGSLVGVLAAAWLIGRWLGIRRDSNLLIGVGTAICGASAIAATNAVIDAEQADVSYSIATIFLFNVIAVLTFPAIGHALGLSPHSFGLWAGTAINDTSSVVAASNLYGQTAVSYGVVVKLTRTLAIVPITVVVAWSRNRHPAGSNGPSQTTGATVTQLDQASSAQDSRGDAVVRRRQLPLRRIFPMFIGAFIVAVAVNSTGIVPDGWHHPLSQLAGWMITAALAAIGLSTKLRDIRTAGLRPILFGGILWVFVGLLTLGLQAITGTL